MSYNKGEIKVSKPSMQRINPNQVNLPAGYHVMPDGSIMLDSAMDYSNGGNVYSTTGIQPQVGKEQPCFECGGEHHMQEGGQQRAFSNNPNEANLYQKKKQDFASWLSGTASDAQMDDQIADGMAIGEYAFKDGGSKKWMQKAAASMKRKGTKGAFTDYCGGKVTAECIEKGLNSPNETTRKRAQFAKAARSVARKENGGEIPEYYHGGPHNEYDWEIGKAYMAQEDQPVSPDIYGDPNLMGAQTTIEGVDYGRRQADINYLTTGRTQEDISGRRQPVTGPLDMGPTVDVQPTGDYGWQPSTDVTPGIPEGYLTDPTIGMQVADESQNTFMDTRESIVSEKGTASFERNRQLERDLKRQQRNRMSGEAKANVILGGLGWVNRVIDNADQRRYAEQMQSKMMAENVFTAQTGSKSGRRGDYMLNVQGAGFRPDDFTSGRFGKGYQEGGEVEMTDEEIAEFLRQGGQIQYLD